MCVEASGVTTTPNTPLRDADTKIDTAPADTSRAAVDEFPETERVAGRPRDPMRRDVPAQLTLLGDDRRGRAPRAYTPA